MSVFVLGDMMIEFLDILKNTLIAFLLLTPFIAYSIQYKFKFSLIKVYIITCILCYLLIVGASNVTDSYLEAVLRTYDLDGNDFFDESELTPDAKIAMNNVTNDTGRAMAIFTGAIISPIFVAIGFGVSFMIEKCIKFLSKKTI